MHLHEWTTHAAQALSEVGIESAKLDAEIILAHTLRKSRTWIHAYRDEPLSPRLAQIADARLALRLDRVPLAYIIGHKEFYGRRFDVTPAVLIPRPESEQMIELLKEVLPATEPLPGTPAKRLVDIGSGSGALGITAKLECPALDVTLLDISRPALAVAQKNATKLSATVAIQQSNLLDDYPFAPDIALANLPYVDATWQYSPELRHEPHQALFAVDSGLALIKKCFEALAVRMTPGGIAIFEADPRQWPAITSHAKTCGFRPEKQQEFTARFIKT